ncbi:MAG: peptide chain release factor N(5)-glutamine methyltransferase [Paracoccaceae bacterium]|nr:peptide chain release factor N(5)-glutamine methyltransferase [Paracoccaceae bacterium]
MNLLGHVLRSFTQELKDKTNMCAQRDAMLLLCFGLDLSMNEVYLDQNRTISKTELIKLKKLLERRVNFEPIAKIIGKKQFWDSSFYVDKTVLDPRPETELLIESVLSNLGSNKTILDLGTGSGCIAISLALALSDVKITGSDISEEALIVARKNSKTHQVKTCFIKSNWFRNISKKYDIIVSNPPYISDDEFFQLPRDVKNYEPRIALLGGPDGLTCYRDIAHSISSHLTDQGVGYFEIGQGQRCDVLEIFSWYGLSAVDVKKDLNGIDRVVCVKKDA